MNKIFLGCIAPLFALVTPSYGMNFTLVGAGGLSGGVFAPSNGFTSGNHSYQLGGGLLLGYQISRGVSIEWGLLYLPRGFSQTFTGEEPFELTFRTIQFPLLLRIQLLSSISVGVGGYFSHGVGFIIRNPTSSPTQQSLMAYGAFYGADDFGLEASVSFKLGITPSMSMVIDGRILSGLANICKIGEISTYLTDYQALVGIRFGK